MTNDWPYPGARWWKFDFHTHTPASADTTSWKLASGTPDEVTPVRWLLKFMEAGIDCVAITDHNSGAWIDSLKSTYATMLSQQTEGFRELHLFPGVEISVNGGFHLLAIFDPIQTTRTITDLLATIAYQGTDGDSDGVTTKGAVEVLKAIHEAGGIAIPAHVDQGKGLLRNDSAGSNRIALDANTVRQVLRNHDILAMEVVNTAWTKPSLYTEEHLRWSEVVGSDCHNFRDATAPGSRFTWVKMARPTLEGLRLALLDGQEISIRRSDEGDFSPFRKPEHFIESIEINDASVMGRRAPASLALNPYFNALVGGRGTGKSTVLHALRLAYRREDELESGTEPAETFDRFKLVPRSRTDKGGLRTSTSIQVTVSRDAVRHRLHWRQDGGAHAVEDFGGSGWVPSSAQAVTKARFPLRLFSQGQIASLADESQQSLLAVVDEAAGTSNAQENFAEAKRALFATRANVRELDGKLQAREALHVALEDVQRKLERFEATNHAEVLKTFQRTSRQSSEIDRQFEIADTQSRILRKTAADLIPQDLPEGLFDAVADIDALDAITGLTEALAMAKSELTRVADRLDATSMETRSKLDQSPWRGCVEQAHLAYEQLREALQIQGVSDPSEYGRLVQEQQRLETETKRLDALLEQRTVLETLAETQQLAVWSARRAISELRKEFLSRTLSDNPFVRIELRPYAQDAQAIDRSLREILGISAPSTFQDELYNDPQDGTPTKGIIAAMIAAMGAQDLSEVAIGHIQQRLRSACEGAGGFGARFNKYLAGESEKRPELTDHISCWFPDDSLQVKYSRRGDGRDFQSIGKASAGQRAAAMLAFLLAHGDEPLVLDQPEDDLDNHLIYDLVVRQIRANKLRRQLIIVTHNPNIVVNGDAEMIHALDFNHQCFVKKSGSLQDQEMRDEICVIMEGGADAFERRYQRLGRKAS